jgi:photosystem II stability/assembly factor-like uncharacterized protein
MKRIILITLFFLFAKHSFTQVKNIYPPVSAPANNQSVVYPLDDKTMFIGGFNRGYILKTIDRGENWIPLRVENALNIQGFFFTSSLQGWAKDGFSLYKTIDGGIQWERVSSFSRPILNFTFANDSIGLLFTADGRLYRTTNGGSKWEIKATYSNVNFLALHAATDKIFIIANPIRAVAISYDAGITWQQDPHVSTSLGDFDEFKRKIFYQQPCNVANSAKLNNSDSYSLAERNFFNNSKYAYYINNETNYQLSPTGEFSKYNSNSRVYSSSLAFTQKPVSSLGFFNNDVGIICSRQGIYRTIDGGINWNEVVDLYDWNGAKTSFYDIFFIDSLSGWATSKGDLYKTTDGGNNWSTQRISNNNLFRIGFFGNGDTGLVTEYPNILHKTYNSGTTWQKDPYFKEDKNFSDIVFKDINSIWAIGDTGNIYYTNNFGALWQTISLPNDSLIATSLSFSKKDSKKIWVTTRNVKNSIAFGSLYYTDNGGITWVKKESRLLIWKVQFINDSVGWINGADFFVGSGLDYFFLRTTDGGETWARLAKPNTDYANFKFISENEGILFDGGAPVPSGFAYYTNDGGYNWETLIPENTVTEVAFLGKEQCWFAHGLHQLSKWGKMPGIFNLQTPKDEANIEVLNGGSIVFSWDKVPFVHSYTFQIEYKGKTIKRVFFGDYDIDNKQNFEIAFTYEQMKQLLDSLNYDSKEYILWSVTARSASGKDISKSSETYSIRPILIDNVNGGEANETSIFLFPNPAQDIVTVKVKKELKPNEPVLVVDVTGKQFEIFAVGNCSCSDVRLNVSQLASGMYFIYTDNEVVKFIKQ